MDIDKEHTLLTVILGFYILGAIVAFLVVAAVIIGSL